MAILKRRSEEIVKWINPLEYNFTLKKLRKFFGDELGFIETPVHYPSVMAACENPFNVGLFHYRGTVWALPQTGQMHLEYELLKQPQVPGYYCVSISHRDEPEPEEGRHDFIFPMFEFESHGGIKELKGLEEELLVFLGFGEKKNFKTIDYKDAVAHLGLPPGSEIGSEHEMQLCKDFGPVVFLMNFPEYTSPFWNMNRIGDVAEKIDVIVHGMEVFGSAKRSCDPDEMRSRFFTISDGKYAQALFSKFSKEGTLKELENFLSLPFIPRVGGGIGMTRLIQKFKEAGLMPNFS